MWNKYNLAYFFLLNICRQNSCGLLQNKQIKFTESYESLNICCHFSFSIICLTDDKKCNWGNFSDPRIQFFTSVLPVYHHHWEDVTVLLQSKNYQSNAHLAWKAFSNKNSHPNFHHLHCRTMLELSAQRPGLMSESVML